MQPIPYSELKDLEPIGEGGFGVVYRAKHGRFGTVAYKELNTQILGQRYSKVIIVQRNCITKTD